MVKKIEESQSQFKRVSFYELKRELALTKEPIILMSSTGTKKTPIAVVYPYDEKMEKKMIETTEAFKDKEYSYDEYRKKMLITGLEQLQAGDIMVRPGDIIASESLEEKKKMNKMLAVDLLLHSAHIWAARAEWQICTNCGHMMLPQSVAESETGAKEEDEEYIKSLEAHA